MNGIGARYGLSPATMAALAQIKGGTPDPGGLDPDFKSDPNAIDVDQPSPTATPALDAVRDYATARTASANPIAVQARDILGTKPVQDVSKRAEELGRTAASTGFLGPVGLLVRPPAAEAPKAGAAAGDASLQGPATDNFPTVKTDYGDAVANGQAVPMGVARPAHWSPSTEKQSREGYELDPDALERMGVSRDSAAGHALLAADARHRAATIDAQAELEGAKAKLVANQMGRERLLELQGQKDAYIKDQLGRLNDLATQARAKVDPGQIFQGEQGSLARVWSAVMMGLNQFAVMWRGKGTNASMQIVNDAINRNIDAQKANIAGAQHAYNTQSNLYAQNLQAFGDKERAALATRMNYLDQVQNMLDMKRAEGKGEIADANFHDMQAAVMKQRAEAEKEIIDLTKVKSSEELANKWHEATTGTGGQKGKDPLYVPTLGGYARDAETAQKLNAKGGLRMQMTQNMKEIHGLMERAKGLNSAQNFRELQDIQERIDGLVNDTLTKNTVIEGQGAMSKDDKEVAAAAKSLRDLKVQGTLNSNIERQQKRVWDASVRILEHHRLDGEAHGIQIGTEQYRQGPNGPEPVRVLAGRNKTVSKNTEAYDDLVSPPKGVPKK